MIPSGPSLCQSMNKDDDHLICVIAFSSHRVNLTPDLIAEQCYVIDDQSFLFFTDYR